MPSASRVAATVVAVCITSFCTRAADAAATTQDTAGLLLHSPRDYQVIQRDSSNGHGTIRVSGRPGVECDSVELMIVGNDASGHTTGYNWEAMPLDPVTRAFNKTVSYPAGGWYKVEVQALRGRTRVAHAVVKHVGVGEVFVIAGQSNSTNSGEQRINPESGMVASFDGDAWQLANDPQPGVHDKSGGGSPWPAFGDAMYAKYKVPIGIASTGHGGTSTNQWQPGQELFNWMMTRVHQLGPGGFRALLWH